MIDVVKKDGIIQKRTVHGVMSMVACARTGMAVIFVLTALFSCLAIVVAHGRMQFLRKGPLSTAAKEEGAACEDACNGSGGRCVSKVPFKPL